LFPKICAVWRLKTNVINPAAKILVTTHLDQRPLQPTVKDHSRLRLVTRRDGISLSRSDE
jgi:hypothetical protein